MQRTGKNWWIFFLVQICLSCTAARAYSNQFLPADSVQKPVTKPLVQVPEFHVVRPGETYYRLTGLYQVSLDSLIKWNGKNLILGSKVRVSKATTGSAATQAVRQAAEATPATIANTSSPVKPKVPAISQPAFTADSINQPGSVIPLASSKKESQRLVVIPFDPSLYFSDADEDIALRSQLPRPDIRYIFRARLSAYLNPEGFETITLSGSTMQSGKSELARVYKSVNYNYQEVSFSKHNPAPATEKPVNNLVSWVQKHKSRLAGSAQPEAAGNTSVAHDERKYYGVQVKNPDFYTYFNTTYAADYYLFINQFEIRTDYTNCLDRTKNSFLREFLVHYNIFDAHGVLVAGNKVKIAYVSNVNEIEKIIRDNLPKIAQRILDDLPRPQSPADTVLENAVE